jgi:hypothetical protein
LAAGRRPGCTLAEIVHSLLYGSHKRHLGSDVYLGAFISVRRLKYTNHNIHAFKQSVGNPQTLEIISFPYRRSANNALNQGI